MIAQLILSMGSHMARSQSFSPAVTVRDDGATAASVRVRLGADLEVELGANPTTGYTWRYDVADGARLRFKSRRFRPTAMGPQPPLGSGGIQLFVFEAVASGSERLHFEYRRGPGGKPARKYDLMVTVVPGRNG